MQEKIQSKAGRLHNITIFFHKFKNIPVYKYGVKGSQSLFKEYQDSLQEGEGSVGSGIFHDIYRLLTIYGESKSGLYTYYIKFRHGKIV